MLEKMNKFIGWTTLLTLTTCSGWAPAYEMANCNYEHLVKSNYVYTIQQTKDFKKEVFPYVDDTRKCVISMWVTINEKTYPSQGTYVFGPDMTENQACEFAEKKAKEQVIREVSPVKLSSDTDLSCLQGNSVNGSTSDSKPESGSSNLSSSANSLPQVGEEQVVSVRFLPIKPSWSPDPTHYYGNYDERKVTIGSLFSLIFGGM